MTIDESLADIDFVIRHFAAGLRPEPDLLVSEWADKHRRLSQSSSAEPGAYKTSRTPYLKEIMDCLSARSPVEEVVFMKAAQIGATEAGNNWLGYIIDHAPGPMLAVQPTTETAKRFSKMRLASMVEDCPTLKGKVKDPRSKDSGNTTLMKEFPGGVLVITGANSAVGLRSMPVRYLFLDEIDAYPGDVDNEGDPLDLAVKRTSTFRNRKLFKISTPTIKGTSKIEAAYKRGDQRGYYIPCPHCGHFQTLEWGFGDDVTGGLVWPAGEPHKAAYQCERCAKQFQEFHKTKFLAQGQWRPRVSADPKIRSYHLNSLYSPYGWPDAAWPALAEKWLEDHRDPIKLKSFVNLQLGKPFEDRQSAKVDADVLMARNRKVYDWEIPEGVALLTAGVDVQKNRLEMEVVGWGLEEESWSIAHFIIPGDTAKQEPWQQLDAVFKNEYSNAAGIKFNIRAACIDTGYNTEIVAGYCSDKFQKRIWAVRGKAQQLQVWPKRPTPSKYFRTPVFNVGVDPAKEIIYARLAIQSEGPGFSHFPIDREREYFEQLTSEVCVPNYTTNPPTKVWKKKVVGGRNEALDIRVYALAALSGLKSMGLKLNHEAIKMAERVREAKREMGMTPVEVEAPAPVIQRAVKSSVPRFQRSNWISR